MTRPTRYDRQQDQQNSQENAQQNAQLSNLQNKLANVQSEIVTQPDQVQTQQRLRIHIPSPYTHFLLGQHSPGTPRFGYSGVSLKTDEHFFFDIKKSSVFQSEKFVLMQTKDIWQQVAQGTMELSSPTSVKVVGGQLFLGGMPSPTPPVFNPDFGTDLAAVTPSELQALIDEVTKATGSWDTIASILGMLHSGLFLSKPDPNLNSWLPFLESIIGLGKDALGMLPDGKAAPAKDVTIYGHSAVNVLTPASYMVTAQQDVKSLAGGDTGITSRFYSTIQAGVGAKCFGGFKASVEAGLYAEVKAASTVGMASLRGKAEVKGKEIEIGAAMPNLAQVATKEIKLAATDVIHADAGQKIHLESGEEVLVETQKAKIKTQESVQIQVGDFCIEVTPKGIKIGKGSNGTPSDPLITVEDDTITLSSSGMGMMINKDRVHLGKAGNTLSLADNGTVWLKGKVVKLG